MPQIVDTLACKSVTQVEVGLDFVIALGQDYDENGNPLQLQSSQWQGSLQGPLQGTFQGTMQGTLEGAQEEPVKSSMREPTWIQKEDNLYQKASYSPYSTSNRSYLQKEQSSIQIETSPLS